MKSRELKMVYSTKNFLLSWLSNKFCNWGQRMPTYDIQNNVVGNAAPLWINPSKKFYFIFSIINFILSILFVSSFAALHYYSNNGYNPIPTTNDTSLNNYTTINATNSTITISLINTKTKNETNQTDIPIWKSDHFCIIRFSERFGTFFIVIGSAFLFINAFSNLYLFCIEYASDEEWYRNLFTQFSISIALLIIDIAEYYYVASNFNYYNQYYEVINGFQLCRTLFKFNLYVNLFVAIFISFLSIFQIVKTLKNYKLLFYSDNQEYFRARCDDPNIVILTKT